MKLDSSEMCRSRDLVAHIKQMSTKTAVQKPLSRNKSQEVWWNTAALE